MSFRTQRRTQTITGLSAGADNTTVLNNAFAGLLPGDTLQIPAGTWTHSSTTTGLIVPTNNVRILGYGSTLQGTVPQYAGLKVTGNNVTLEGVRHEVNWGSSTPTRGGGNNDTDCPIAGWQCSNLTLIDCQSRGSRDAGMFFFGVNGLIVRNAQIRDSMADGFHMTYGTTNVYADGVNVVNPGDDGVACVSYTNEPTINSNIRVHNIGVMNGAARGVVISGGTDVHYRNIRTNHTRSSGIYIAHESGSFNTNPVSNASVADAYLYDANYDSSLDNGSVGVFNLVSGTVMTNVLISGVICHDRRGSSSGHPYGKVGTSAGAGGTMTGVVLADICLEGGTGTSTIAVDGLTSGTVTSGTFVYITLTGTGATAITDGTTVSGAGTQVATASTTTSAPGVTLVRCRQGGRWAAA